MALTAGDRLGPYEIVAPLGAGGMGEGYRARDTALRREVALKVLPQDVSRDPDRQARFQREAELLAALNHPNIAAVYGLERSADATGIVLELVEGNTLADLIARGPVPPGDEAAIVGQIADALEAAHERGVIHRDLKPANIKLTPNGTVKVLDFGLAKMLEASGDAGASGGPGAFGPTMSPTLSVHATYAGVILGTAAYMSPEQARGRAVDKRTDIWAFGCLAFEMLTGARPFEGEDIAETIGAVIHKEPAWDKLPPSTPPSMRTALQRCLEKDPKRRLHDIGDVRLLMHGAFESAAPSLVAPSRPVPITRLLLMAAGVISLAAAAAVAAWQLKPSAARADIARFTVSPPGRLLLAVTSPTGRDVAVSPDGTRVVYHVGESPQTSQLLVRDINQLRSSPSRCATGRTTSGSGTSRTRR
jgi:eukaryotic-like serine/threonine-protein kinase